MRFVLTIMTMCILGTVHAQFKITDYQIFSKDGHSFVFFNESGEHVFFATYKKHELIVEDLWTADRERKNAIISQIVNKKTTVFEKKNLEKLDLPHLVSKEYRSENNNISIRFLKDDSYEILDDSDTIIEQGRYYISRSTTILNLTNTEGNYIGAIISKEGLLLVIGEAVFHLITK
jgi:hypothetical protein